MAANAGDVYTESTLTGDVYIESTLKQRLGEVQYGHFSMEIPDRKYSPSNKESPVEVSLGYRRALEFDREDHPGQDFVTVRGGGGYVVGVVADGVSQSFYGNLAASYLSPWLLERLWQDRENPPSEAAVLEGKLKEREGEFAKEVEQVQIPDYLDDMVKSALADVRRKGSQAVFAAFVLNARERQLRLYQVGDVDALIHYPDRPFELVRAPRKGRWSSAGRSDLLLEIRFYEDASGIVIKSDGSGEGWGQRIGDEALSRSAFEPVAEKRASTDDVSFVAAFWGEVQDSPSVANELPVADETPMAND